MNTKIVYSQKSPYICSLKIQYPICLPSTTLTDCWEGPQYITQGLGSSGSSCCEDWACVAVSNLSFIAKAYAMWAPVTLFPVPAQCISHHYTPAVLLCLDKQCTVHIAHIKHAYRVDPESRQSHCYKPDQSPFSGTYWLWPFQSHESSFLLARVK